MTVSILSVVVLVLGLLIYVLSSNPKAAEAGRLAYFAGMLATLMAAGQKVVHLF